MEDYDPGITGGLSIKHVNKIWDFIWHRWDWLKRVIMIVTFPDIFNLLMICAYDFLAYRKFLWIFLRFVFVYNLLFVFLKTFQPT